MDRRSWLKAFGAIVAAPMTFVFSRQSRNLERPQNKAGTIAATTEETAFGRTKAAADAWAGWKDQVFEELLDQYS